jgi:hypothetical protein
LEFGLYEISLHVSPASVVLRIIPQEPTQYPVDGLAKNSELSQFVVPLEILFHEFPKSVVLRIIPHHLLQKQYYLLQKTKTNHLSFLIHRQSMYIPESIVLNNFSSISDCETGVEFEKDTELYV